MADMGFKAMKAKLAKRPGVKRPGALSAFIGNKKYGKGKMQAASKAGVKVPDLDKDGQ